MSLHDRAIRAQVSIHAPARGATAAGVLVLGFEQVSIHAPARGATYRWSSASFTSSCFNPRAREGRDAPGVAPVSAVCTFQSTRPRGARPPVDAAAHQVPGLFQSTRPRGARPARGRQAGRACRVSIHAPARGATASSATRPSRMASFNPRAREGRDARFGHRWVQWVTVSIHAPARGATSQPRQRDLGYVWFQSTRPRGARLPGRNSTPPKPRSFNPRAREGRDLRQVEAPG